MKLSDKQIKICKEDLSKNSNKVKKSTRLFYIGSDPTRLKILMLLKKKKELCATDIANILGVSISAISHQAHKLENSGILERTKMGQSICYSINDEKMLNDIIEHLDH